MDPPKTLFNNVPTIDTLKRGGNPPISVSTQVQDPEFRKSKNIPIRADQIETVNAGRNEAVKEVIKEEEKNKLKFDELLIQSQKVLFKCSSVFPFDIFPDEIVIDIHKVNIYFWEFFKSGRLHSLYIQNIGDVFIDKNLLFATLRIVDKTFVDNEVRVKYLKRKDAEKVRRIIEGLVIAWQHGIDLTKVEDKNIAIKVEYLGRSQISDK